MHKSINSWVLHQTPRIVAKMILFAKKLVSLISIDSQACIVLVQLLDWNIIVLLPDNCNPNFLSVRSCLSGNLGFRPIVVV